MKLYIDPRDWWVGYYRGDRHHYVCLLPTVVIRWSRRNPGGRTMPEYECYQSAEMTQVLLPDTNPSNHSAPLPDAVVSISRVVGNPTARGLMRLCRYVLNGDELSAQRELDDLLSIGDEGQPDA